MGEAWAWFDTFLAAFVFEGKKQCRPIAWVFSSERDACKQGLQRHVVHPQIGSILTMAHVGHNCLPYVRIPQACCAPESKACSRAAKLTLRGSYRCATTSCLRRGSAGQGRRCVWSFDQRFLEGIDTTRSPDRDIRKRSDLSKSCEINKQHAALLHLG